MRYEILTTSMRKITVEEAEDEEAASRKARGQMSDWEEIMLVSSHSEL